MAIGWHAGGNFLPRPDDNRGVTCAMWREALSARLDGEEFSAEWDGAGRIGLGDRTGTGITRGVSAADVDAHLDACDACRQWYEDAAFITRLARVDAGSGGVGGIPDSVLEATPGPTRARLAKVLRVVLALLGAGQILLAIAQLAGPMGADGTALMHMTHEFTAWNAAIGASFLFIAWRRTRPAALLPLLTAFVGVLTVLSVDDIVHGDVSAGRLGTHALLLAGYVVVIAMSRPSLNFDAPPGLRQRSHASAWRLGEHDELERDAPSRTDRPDSPAASAERRRAA
jgi:predicted anti-sigma-YlaC factor YlaD